MYRCVLDRGISWKSTSNRIQKNNIWKLDLLVFKKEKRKKGIRQMEPRLCNMHSCSQVRFPLRHLKSDIFSFYIFSQCNWSIAILKGGISIKTFADQ